MTLQTINSLQESEDPQRVAFNITVIESNRSMAPLQYPNTLTVYPKEEFGFNKYLNIGVRMTSNNYVCLCNNDLIFHRGWASSIIDTVSKNEEIDCASTYCPTTHGRSGFDENSLPLEGYENLFSGWCFFIQRKIFDKIGEFDEKFVFWYADNDFIKTLQQCNLKNFLISSARVTHINSETSSRLSPKEFKKLSLLPLLYYNYKWNKGNYFLYRLKTLYFSLRIKYNLI